MRQALPKRDSLVLAVITQEQVVIEPTSVSYQQGDTIRTALKNSGHSFEGMMTGFVSAIDGTADNYTLFYDQGGYDLDAAADTVTVVCIYLLSGSVFPAVSESPVRHGCLQRQSQWRPVVCHGPKRL